MTVLGRISNGYRNLSPSERKVADFVQVNLSEILMMPLQMLAHKCGTSEATVLRFCRSLGFTGYQDFKSELIPEVLQSNRSRTMIEPQGDFDRVVHGVNDQLQRDITNTLDGLERHEVERVVEEIMAAEAVFVVGLAGSSGVGRILAGMLMSLGTMASIISDRVEMERMAALLKPEHLLFAVSHSGDTEEVCIALERGKEKGTFTVAITNFSPSKVSSIADITLLTCMPERMLGSYSCSPRIGQLAILELLTHLLLNAKGDKK